MRLARMKLISCLLLAGIPAVAWIGSEVRWANVNSPRDKFSSVTEYLASGRLPSRVTALTTNGSTYLVAYSPMDCWLAVPSGPAAYVFDESGDMVVWSRDTVDDGSFQAAWPLRQQVEASVEDLKRLGFHQDDAGNSRYGDQPQHELPAAGAGADREVLPKGRTLR